MYIYKDNTGFLIQALIDSNTHMYLYLCKTHASFEISACS